MTDTVDEDVVCKNCGARSRSGFVPPQGRQCEYQNDLGHDIADTHDWVPISDAHQYDIEVEA